MRKREEEQGAGIVRLMACVLPGALLSLALCLALLLVLSLLISAGHMSEGPMLAYTMAACGLSSFLGGLFAVSRYRTKTLLVGAGTGGAAFLLDLTAGFLLYQEMSAGEHGVGLFCVSLLGGALAGLAGGKQKKKRRK